MENYYNDIDEKACAWTEELMSSGNIAKGIVDNCSITDIKYDLSKFKRVHFFNGISGWEEALRLARWPDEQPVWCASLPCQSFSSAGKQKGFDDERGQLWYPFLALVQKYRPDRIFGEQVKAAVNFGWVDRIRTDLEAAGYTFGFAVLGAHSLSAPHLRQRLFWVADSQEQQPHGNRDSRGWRGESSDHSRMGNTPAGGRGISGDASQPGSGGHADSAGGSGDDEYPAWMVLPDSTGSQQGRTSTAPAGHRGSAESASSFDWMADRQQQGLGGQSGDGHDRHQPGRLGADEARPASASGGAWSAFDILPCRDGKARRVESGTFPLVDGIPDSVVPGSDPSVSEAQATAEARVIRLKGYGNAIVPQVAAAFITAYLGTADHNG